MAFKSIIDIDDSKLTIIFTFTGREEYYLNGKLLAKYSDKPSNATRIFDINGNKISIDYEITKANYRCHLYRNDKIINDDVFPEWTKAFNKNNKQ